MPLLGNKQQFIPICLSRFIGKKLTGPALVYLIFLRVDATALNHSWWRKNVIPSVCQMTIHCMHQKKVLLFTTISPSPSHPRPLFGSLPGSKFGFGFFLSLICGHGTRNKIPTITTKQRGMTVIPIRIYRLFGSNFNLFDLQGFI